MDDGRSSSWFVRGIAHAMRVIRWPPDTSPFFCFRSKRVDRFFSSVHEKYLGAVDLTSHIGIIPTCF